MYETYMCFRRLRVLYRLVVEVRLSLFPVSRNRFNVTKGSRGRPFTSGTGERRDPNTVIVRVVSWTLSRPRGRPPTDARKDGGTFIREVADPILSYYFKRKIGKGRTGLICVHRLILQNVQLFYKFR